jgi:hypothetical protein
MELDAEPFDQRHLASIADGFSTRVAAHNQIETDHRRESAQVEEACVRRQPAFDTTRLRRGDPDRIPHVRQGEAAVESGRPELEPDLS